MEAPIIVENFPLHNFPIEVEETGFPFDDSDYDTRNHLQSTLDNIAQRHPDLATRLDQFGSFGRKRYGSGSSSEDTRPGSSRIHGSSFDSFPSGFNRFPFTSRFDDFGDDIRTEEKPPEVPRAEKPRGRKPANPNLPQHLSNTVDLGQKQVPVEETRTQRSMSAPPENRSTNTTTTNTNKAENEPPRDMGNARSRTPTNSAPAKERIIPIRVEGRDELLMPKNTNIPASNKEPERMFSGEPDQFYQQYSQPTWQPFGRHQTPPNRQQKMPSPSPQPKASTPQPEPEPEKPPVNLNDPLEKIKSVKNDVLDLMQQVETFIGTRKDKRYMYLDEMLTRNLLKLDNVETEGKDNIRTMRREAIKCIQECINKLEAKAQAHEQQTAHEETPQVDTDPTPQPEPVDEPHKKKTFKSNISIELKNPEDQSSDAPESVPEPMEAEKAPDAPTQTAETAASGEPMEVTPVPDPDKTTELPHPNPSQ